MFRIPGNLCRHLEEAGFPTVELLAAATVDDLVTRAGVKPHHAEELIQRADDIVRPKSGFKTSSEVEEE